MTKRQIIAKIVKEMKRGGRPQRLIVRFNKLAVKPGYAIEDHMGLAIGDTFETAEAAHEFHSIAWHKAWEGVE